MLIRKLNAAASDLAERVRDGNVEVYSAVDGTHAIEITDDPAQASGEAMRLLFSSGRFGRAGGEWLFHVGLWTPAEFREEFLAWYRMEHVPILLECPVWNGCRFVEQPIENGCQFYGLHQLSDRSALESEQRAFSRTTAWFRRFKKHDWFDEPFVRTLYRLSRDRSPVDLLSAVSSR